jgi:hypothetical protein
MLNNRRSSSAGQNRLSAPAAKIESRPPAPVDHGVFHNIQRVFRPSGNPAGISNSKPLPARPMAMRATENEVSAKSDTLSNKINTQEIADKVYRLMKQDLLIERERTTRLGE